MTLNHNLLNGSIPLNNMVTRGKNRKNISSLKFKTILIMMESSCNSRALNHHQIDDLPCECIMTQTSDSGLPSISCLFTDQIAWNLANFILKLDFYLFLFVRWVASIIKRVL